jgi:hypothetical protein
MPADAGTGGLLFVLQRSPVAKMCMPKQRHTIHSHHGKTGQLFEAAEVIANKEPTTLTTDLDELDN